MNGLVMILAIAGLVVVVPLAAVAIATLAMAAGRPPSVDPSQAAAAARRHGLVVAWVAWVTATAVAFVAAAAGMTVLRGHGRPGGLVLALLPMTAALAYVAVHVAGEHSWPRPTGTVRRAVLAPRRQPVARLLTGACMLWAGLLAALLVGTGLTADEGGRAITVVRGAASNTAGPYPGWYYGVPLLLGAAALVAAGSYALRVVAHRPAVVDADPAYDDASRRLSAHRVLRGVQLGLGLTLVGVQWWTAAACINVELQTIGPVLAWATPVVLVATLVACVLPGPRLPGPAPAPAPGWAPPPTPGAADPRATESRPA